MEKCIFLVRLVLDLNQAGWDEDDIIDYVNSLNMIKETNENYQKGEEK